MEELEGWTIEEAPEAEDSLEGWTASEVPEGWAVEAKKRDENTMLDSIAAYGQIAAESVSAGVIGDEFVAGVRSLLPDPAYDFGPTVSMEKQSFGNKFQMYHEDAKAREAEFRDENKALSIGTDIVGGLGTGFAVAGKLGNAATRAGNMLRQGSAAGAETGLHGFMEGEGLADRAKQAGIWGTLGVVAGGAGGALMRGQTSIDEIAESMKGVNASDTAESIAGKEGFASKAARESNAGPIQRVFDWASESLQDAGGKLVSQRFGSLLNRADGLKMRNIAQNTDHLDSTGAGTAKLDKFFHTPIGTKIMMKINNSGAKNADGDQLPAFIRVRMLDEASADIHRVDPELGKTFDEMRKMVADLAKKDVGNQATAGFFPRRIEGSQYSAAKANEAMSLGRRMFGDKVSSSNFDDSLMPILNEQTITNYRTPVASFMDYMEDIAISDALNTTFKLNIKPPGPKGSTTTGSIKKPFEMTDPSRVTVPEKVTKAKTKVAGGSKSNVQIIRKALDKKLKAEGAEKYHRTAAGALVDELATASRAGPNEIMQTLRTATSAALLGTPENAILQLGDTGVAAYQSGLRNTLAVLPRTLRSLFTNTDKIVDTGGKMYRAPDLGITRQFLGEVKREGTRSFSKMMDFTADKIMSATGVRKINRLGQENSVNAAWRRAKAIAARDPDKLADLPATRGWTSGEIDMLAEDLRKGIQTDRVASYLFTTLTDVQPVSATALPRAYAQHPNGRVLYAMKTYMLKQMNVMRGDIFGKMRQAERLGLGTKEGQKLMRESLMSAARYTTFVAGLNAVVDDHRKIPRTGENKYEPVKSTASQLVANATGGTVNLRADEFGGSSATSVVPPAVKAPLEFADGLMDLVQGDPDLMMRVMTTYVPGLRQAKWMNDVAEENM